MSKEADCCTPQGSTAQGRGPRTTSDVIRSALRDPRVLMIGGLAIIAGAMALNWTWLTAIGAASIILALAPCAVMCALGMCMMPKQSASTPTDQGTPEPTNLPTAVKPPQVLPGSERYVA